MGLRWLIWLPLLTLVLGFSLALAYYLVGGSLALRGPYVLSRSWPLIYPLLAVFALGVGFAVEKLWGGRRTLRAVALFIALAWVGELVVLLIYGSMDSDLGRVGPFAIWIIATCGPLQPAAAVTGAWLSRKLARSRVAAPRS